MGIVLRWAIADIFWFHVVNEGSKGTLCEVENEKYSSETLGKPRVDISVKLDRVVPFLPCEYHQDASILLY